MAPVCSREVVPFSAHSSPSKFQVNRFCRPVPHVPRGATQTLPMTPICALFQWDGLFRTALPCTSEHEAEKRMAALQRKMKNVVDVPAYNAFKRAVDLFDNGKLSRLSGLLNAEILFDAAVDTFGVRLAKKDILPELVAVIRDRHLHSTLHATCMAHNADHHGFCATDVRSASGWVRVYQPKRPYWMEVIAAL